MLLHPARAARRATAAAALALVSVLASPAAPALAESPWSVPVEPAGTVADANIVDVLNARYADTAMSCDGGEAAYFCNGVVVRTTSTVLPTPLQISRDGASFSYLRADLGIETLWPAASAGMILQPWADQASQMRLRCAFPSDAATNTRPDSCDRSTAEVEYGNPEGSSAPCLEQGIDSGVAWSPHFDSLEWKNGNCAFGADLDGFTASLEMRALLPADDYLDAMWNEVVVGAWTPETTPALPIEAFFFIDGKADGLEAAEALQDEFAALSGRIVPIVGIDFDREAPFIPVPSSELSVTSPAAQVGEARPEFAGRATPGSSVVVLDAAERTVCAATATDRGRWSCIPDVAFAPGAHEVSVVETSTTGVVSVAHAFQYLVNAAPRIISPAAGERIVGKRVVVTGEAEPSKLIEVREAGSFLCLTFSTVAGTFSCTVESVGVGEKRWTATANAGVATSPATEFSFVVALEDETGPVAPEDPGTPVEPQVTPVTPVDGGAGPVADAAGPAEADLARTGVGTGDTLWAAGFLVLAGLVLVVLRVGRSRSAEIRG